MHHTLIFKTRIFFTYFAQKVAYIVLFICVNYVPYFEADDDDSTIETVHSGPVFKSKTSAKKH